MAAAAEERVARTIPAAISKMLVQVHVEHAGRGPTKARTYLNEDVITSVLEDALTPVEKTLNDDGQRETVERVRHKLREAMREDIVGRVETITGRRVRVFLSANELDPDVAVETFLLESLDDEDEQPARRGQGEAPTPRRRRDLQPGTPPAPRAAF